MVIAKMGEFLLAVGWQFGAKRPIFGGLFRNQSWWRSMESSDGTMETRYAAIMWGWK